MFNHHRFLWRGFFLLPLPFFLLLLSVLLPFWLHARSQVPLKYFMSSPYPSLVETTMLSLPFLVLLQVPWFSFVQLIHSSQLPLPQNSHCKWLWGICAGALEHSSDVVCLNYAGHGKGYEFLAFPPCFSKSMSQKKPPTKQCKHLRNVTCRVLPHSM